MMRYVRTIDKTVETATPRGVTPCSSDPTVEERIRVFYTHVKVFTCRTYSPTEPSNFKFSWFRLQYRCYAFLRELPAVIYNSSFPLGMPCIGTDSFTCSIDIVSNYRLVFKKRILSGILRMFCLLVGLHAANYTPLFSTHKADEFSPDINL